MWKRGLWGSLFISFLVLLGSDMYCLVIGELQAQGPYILACTHSILTTLVLMTTLQDTPGTDGQLWEGQSRDDWVKWAVSEIAPRDLWRVSW